MVQACSDLRSIFLIILSFFAVTTAKPGQHQDLQESFLGRCEQDSAVYIGLFFFASQAEKQQINEDQKLLDEQKRVEVEGTAFAIYCPYCKLVSYKFTLMASLWWMTGLTWSWIDRLVISPWQETVLLEGRSQLKIWVQNLCRGWWCVGWLFKMERWIHTDDTYLRVREISLFEQRFHSETTCSCLWHI